MTGIDDVARASGVSTATVSRALRGLPNVSETTRERVRLAAQQLGYVASSSASGLATGRTLAMGVVIPSLDLWYYSTVIEGVDSALRAASYDLILFNLGGRRGDRERVFHRSILRKRTDALIALCIDFTEDERKQLASTGHPTIVIGGRVRGLPHVGIDERGAARLATEHLIGLGHRRIAHLAGAVVEGLTREVPVQRRLGYEQAMASAGLAARTELSVEGNFDMAAARRAMTTLLALGAGTRPTAVFADSDEMAMGAILAINDAGLRVPRDISVVGIDDHDLADSFGLTTIAQEPFAQGALAARMLLDELGGRRVRTRSVRYPVRLIERTSTAPPLPEGA
ncbi:MAG TPA: LacI family DNA-binding transcriptional regulator [Humibacter sp.]|nr:LacI family DNA-binding transcriptional regulator [Humibacter sp.]